MTSADKKITSLSSGNLTIDQAIAKAIQATKQGEENVARELYHAVLKHQPNHRIARKYLSKLNTRPPSDQIEKSQIAAPLQILDLVNLFHSNEMVRTEDGCRTLLQTHPKSLDLLNLLGASLERQGKLREAAEAYSNAIQLKPDFVEGYNNRGNVLKELGQLDDALNDYDNSILLNPDYAEAYYNRGNAQEQAGKLDVAVEDYDKAIRLNPDIVQAHYNRGNVLEELGQLDAAVKSYNKAIELNPDFAEAYSNCGNALKKLGQLNEAIEKYSEAIRLKPDFTEAYYNRGNTSEQLGQFNAAVNDYSKAIELNPKLDQAFYNRGLALEQLGRPDAAVKSYNKAIELNPDFAEVYNNRGNALKTLGHMDEAMNAYTKAIQLKPDFVEAYNNRGIALQKLGQLDAAAKSYGKAIRLSPDYAAGYNNLGNTLQQLGKMDEAIKKFDKAIELKPDFPEAYNNRGNVLRDLGLLSDAISSYSKASQLKPDYPEAYNNWGVSLQELGQLNAAVKNYNKAIQLSPDLYTMAYSNLLTTLNYTTNVGASERFSIAQKFGKYITEKAQTHCLNHQNLSAKKRLRVGLVSADLRLHPVGHFLENVLSSIDNSKIELVAYPTTPEEDDLTERIKPLFSSWEPICGQNDDAVANLIHSDAINVLIDLSGHTAGNRLPVFGYRPSPVQVSWLGYFATTGLNEMDYVIGDPYVTPPKYDKHFTEKIWRLPETRWCFTPPDAHIELSAPPALNCGYVTFGCFNNITKINNKVVELWANLLHLVADSRLFLKARQFRDNAVCNTVIQQFAAKGINSERIKLEGPEEREEYLAAYNKVDIALDPFPFTGGTTSVESLWMGVPLVTLAGNSLISRQGVGILMNAGLSDWIAEDEKEYLAKAVSFATNLNELTVLRARLRPNILASPLFDAPRFACHLENALLEMWSRRVKQN